MIILLILRKGLCELSSSETFSRVALKLLFARVSSYNLGCFTGCILTFILGDWLGRRRAMWLAMALITVGAVLQTTGKLFYRIVIEFSGYGDTNQLLIFLGQHTPYRMLSSHVSLPASEQEWKHLQFQCTNQNSANLNTAVASLHQNPCSLALVSFSPIGL